MRASRQGSTTTETVALGSSRFGRAVRPALCIPSCYLPPDRYEMCPARLTHFTPFPSDKSCVNEAKTVHRRRSVADFSGPLLRGTEAVVITSASLCRLLRLRFPCGSCPRRLLSPPRQPSSSISRPPTQLPAFRCSRGFSILQTTFRPSQQPQTVASFSLILLRLLTKPRRSGSLRSKASTLRDTFQVS